MSGVQLISSFSISSSPRFDLVGVCLAKPESQDRKKHPEGGGGFLLGWYTFHRNICLPTQLKGGLLDLRDWSSACRIRSGGGPELCRHLAAFDHLADLPAWDPFHRYDFFLLVRCRRKGTDPKSESWNPSTIWEGKTSTKQFFVAFEYM